jgi:hypothetical protein
VSGGTKTHQITIEIQSITIFTRNSRKTKREKLTQREQKRKDDGKEKRINFLYQTENAKERKELSLHSWVEQARQKHQKIEVFVCVFCVRARVCGWGWGCVQKAFFLSRIQRRIYIESKMKGCGKK